MTNPVRFRHEIKFGINYADYLTIRSRISKIMKEDAYVFKDGKYTVRSIYFDNYRDKALREKIDGVAEREKFRIRYYNDDLSFISLEKKYKHNNLSKKYEERISEDECRKILAGNISWMKDSPSSFIREFYYKMLVDQLKPRVLVSYTREPYIYSAGNVRVTIDSNIRSTMCHPHFLEEKPIDIDVADEKGQMVLEIKYDDYLPDIIADALQIGNTRQIAISKYSSCRKFG